MPTIVNTAFFIKADSNSNGTVTLVIPSGGQAGDILCACVASSDSLNPSSLSASGWSIKTENYTTTNGSSSPHMALLTRPWTGSDPVTVNIGADIRDDHGFIMLIRGADTSNPVSIISPSYVASNSANYTSQGLTTVAANSLMVGFCASKNGAASYADDTNGPSGMTVLYNRRTRVNTVAIRIAIATQTIAAIGATGTRLWSAFNDTANYTAAFNFIINASAVTESITSVNSGAGITAGSTGNTAQLAGYSTTPTSATHGPLAMTGLSYNGGPQVLTFDDVPYADGQTRPPFDGVADFTVVASGSSQTATLVNVPTNPPTGWATVTISSPVTDDITYIGNHTDLSNHEIVYETKIGQSLIFPAEGLVVYTDGGVSLPSDLAGDHIMYKRNLTTGLVIQLTVTINGDGDVVIVTGNSEATFKGGRLEAKESLATFRAKLPFQAQSVASDITTLRTDFNSLLSKMALAGWFEGGEEQLTMLKISLQCGLPQLVKRLKAQAPVQMPVQTASIASDVTALRNDLNALLTKLKDSNLMATS